MSEINLDFTVNDPNLSVTVQTTDLTFVPDNIELNMFLGGLGVPGGSVGQIQFNAGEVLAGSSNLTYNAGVTTVSNVEVTNSANLGSVGNIIITGGVANAILTTNGSGALSWGNSAVNAQYANIANTANTIAGANVTGTVLSANYAAYAGNVVNASQGNITTIGALTSLSVTGVSRLGPIGNVKITGGTNGYVLQTDGTGNLSWTVPTGGGGGNGSPGGVDTQVQFNDSGSFAGNVGFAFDKTTGNLYVPAVISNVYGSANTVSDSSQPNVTSLGNLTSVTVQGLTSIQEAVEKVNVSTSPSTGTVNFDVLNQAIQFNTANATSNFTLNIRGNSTTTLNSVMSSNQSMTLTFINTNGTTGYYPTAISIDGAAITPLWMGVPPYAGGANSKEVYTFNIIKTATNTYTVFGSNGRFV